MVSFTQLVATAIATAAFVVAAPTPDTLAARVTTETAGLEFTAAGYFITGNISNNGTWTSLPNADFATSASFTVERDPSNTDNVLISSDLGPCGVEATVFVCSATTTAASFGFATFGQGLDLTNGGILSFNGVGFNIASGGRIVNVVNPQNFQDFLVSSQ